MPRLYGHNKSHWEKLEPTTPPSPLLSRIQLTRVFQAERARTERTGSIFSLVVITLRKETDALRSQAVRVIEHTARLYDAIGEVGKRSLGIILPECASEDALSFADRVIAHFGQQDIQAQVNIYSYPMDWIDHIDGGDQDGDADETMRGHDDLTPMGKPHLHPPTLGSQSRGLAASEDDAALSDLMEDTPCGDLEPYFEVPLPVWRRILDVLVTAPLLLLGCVTVLPLVALLIRLDSQGSVFFKQTRLGQGVRPFGFVKFRSMHHSAGARRSELDRENEQSGAVSKMHNDPQITRVGYWLRKLSIDELPQLWHVLRGHMTLVGPRPPLPGEYANYLPWQRRRLDFKGGIMCLWQINGRSKIGFTEGVRMDIRYIRHRSWWLDLKILLRTPLAVLGGRGAY